MQYRTAKILTHWLERSVIVLAIGAVLFRALIYPQIGTPAGAAWGVGDVVDFALALGLFLLGGICAGCGIYTSTLADSPNREVAYRPVLIGMTTFVVYYLIHPYIPALS